MISRRELLVGGATLLISRPFQAPRTSFIGDAVFDRIVAKAGREGWGSLPIGNLIGAIGLELLGAPYVGRTLELDDRYEICAINLEGLDCVTFFEDALDLARVIKQGHPTKSAFLAAVRMTRYRGGVQGDYTSRLHYTTDWIWDNGQRGIVCDLTPTLSGSIPITQKVGFMSTHPSVYSELKANPEWVSAIGAVEAKINGREMSYLPMDRVAEAESLLKTGDIIGVTTTQPGIDVAHTGLAYRSQDGVVHFLDASSAPSKMKVTLEGRLSDSIRWSKRNTGIVVARPVEPRL